MSSKRSAILEQFQQGKTTVRLLNVPRQTVLDVMGLFEELDNDGRRPGSGRKYSVSTSKNRKVIEKRVQRNPRVSMRKIAHGMGISDRYTNYDEYGRHNADKETTTQISRLHDYRGTSEERARDFQRHRFLYSMVKTT
ncbi:uncharacterized protein TNCV_996951 [Trichonephila clavipes]|nr:uncharacterized protein TNCV_996951 [Trichonephila clavipes]